MLISAGRNGFNETRGQNRAGNVTSRAPKYTVTACNKRAATEKDLSFDLLNMYTTRNVEKRLLNVHSSMTASNKTRVVFSYDNGVKANSHRHARQDKTVLSASRPLRRCELDSRQLKTVADGKFEV